MCAASGMPEYFRAYETLFTSYILMKNTGITKLLTKY
jgi:hypothetical protein